MNKGIAWEATQGEFVLFLLFTFAFIFCLFLPFLRISPYIGDNVSFKCGGGDLGCVLILYFSKKKKKKIALCFCGFQRFLVVYVMSKIQLSLKNS